MPVTLADVAERAGVSIKTVSRVINHESRVTEATRRRVMDAVEALGYTPNQSAQRLARGHSRLVGLLMYDATHSYLMDVIHGLIEVGDALGYGLSLYRVNVNDAHQVSHAIAHATQRQVEGFVSTPPCDHSPRLITSLQEMRFPFVQLSPHDRSNGSAWVAAMDEAGSYDATRYLIGLGHRRIGFVQGNQEHQASWDRLDGYKRALREAGIGLDPELIRQGCWTFESGLSQARDLLRLPRPPTAIMAGNDEAAAGVVQATWEHGWKCPDDISIVGFDDVPLACEVTPPLTTVRQPIYEMAKIAMRVLIEELIPGHVGEVTREVEAPLVIRRSTAAPHRDEEGD